ncbi:hemolysin type calcium-binding protein [Ochrobactrum sp. BH3]|nr:hemolysin type calcium-binding protein [Ochrobactrum sp. BH3]
MPEIEEFNQPGSIDVLQAGFGIPAGTAHISETFAQVSVGDYPSPFEDTSAAKAVSSNTFNASMFSVDGAATDGDDLIQGGPGADWLLGGDGDDYLEGGTGNDFLAGGAGRDSLNDGDGDDLLLGGDGADVLYSYDGDDYLDGGNGNDRLASFGGSDVIRGGGGSDEFTGGPGADTFSWFLIPPTGEGVDHILDFDGASGDTIEFSETAQGVTGIDDFDAFRASSRDVEGGVYISFNGTDDFGILVENVSLADLSPSDIVFDVGGA